MGCVPELFVKTSRRIFFTAKKMPLVAIEGKFPTVKMSYKGIFVAEMVGLSFVLTALQLPLVALFIVPLIMAIAGFYYSYFFALGTLYLDIILRPADLGQAIFVNLLFKFSSFTGIPAYAMFALYFGLILPWIIFMGILVSYKPLRYLTRKTLGRRIKIVR
jgi:hypothetical protein